MWNRKQLLTLFSLCLLLIAFAFNFSRLNLVYGSGDAWLTGWLYRRSHVITAASNAGTNYQMVFIIKNTSGSDSGNTVYINNLTNNDFGDLRFTASDGSTVLSAWNCSTNMGINVTCWVKITDDLSSTAVTIYLYYGNSGASTQWSFFSVFPFGDPWDSTTLNTTTWPTVTGTPTYTISTTTHSLKVTNCGGTWYGGSGFRGSSVTFPTYYRVDDPYRSNTGNSGFNMSIVTTVAGAGGIYFMIKNTTTWSSSYYGAVGIEMIDAWTGFAHYRYDIYVDTVSKYGTGEVSSSSFTTLERVTKIQNSTAPTYNYTVQDTTTLRVNASTVFGTSLIEIGINKHQSYAFITNVEIGAFAVRSYVSPEPADSTWGSQQGAVPICDETKTSINSTNSVSVAQFSTFWYILVGSLSGYVFSYNMSGSYVNDTWVAFDSANNSWANATHTISLTVGYVISSLVYANNSENGWATSALNSFIVTATFTYYFDTGGSLEVNGTSKNNGTSIVYNSQNTIHLSALPSYGYTLLDFSSSYSSSTDNPWDFTLVNVTTIWAHFTAAGGVPTYYAIARFEFEPSNPYVNVLLTFNATQTYNTTAVTDYSWNFDDGNTTAGSDLITVTHNYTSVGLYNVSLTVTSSGTNSAFTFHLLNVTVNLYLSGWEAGNSSGYSDGYSAGYSVGYSDGHDVGYDDGYAVGWEAGNASGYVTGWEAGNSSGYSSGWEAGNSTGYAAGWTAGNLTGYSVGWTAGNSTGYVLGWTDGNYTGYLAGFAAGGGSGGRAGYAAYWFAGLLVILLIAIPTVVFFVRRK